MNCCDPTEGETQYVIGRDDVNRKDIKSPQNSTSGTPMYSMNNDKSTVVSSSEKKKETEPVEDDFKKRLEMMLAKGPAVAPTAKKATSVSPQPTSNANNRKNTGMSVDDRVDIMMSFPKLKKANTMTKRSAAYNYDF